MSYDTGNPVPSKDPRDLVDNAENMDEAVNGTGDSWTDRLGVSRPTLKRLEDDYPQAGVDADRAEAARDVAVAAETEVETARDEGIAAKVSVDSSAAQASADADRAETAADAALSAGAVFTTTGDGLAATAEGDYFWVISSDDARVSELWLHDTGSVAVDTGKRTASSSLVFKPQEVGRANGWIDPFFRHLSIGEDVGGLPRWFGNISQGGPLDTWEYIVNPLFKGRALRKNTDGTGELSGPVIPLADIDAAPGDTITVRALIVSGGSNVVFAGRFTDGTFSSLGSQYSTGAVATSAIPKLVELEMTVIADAEYFRIYPYTNTASGQFDIVALWAGKGDADSVPVWPNYNDADYFRLATDKALQVQGDFYSQFREVFTSSYDSKTGEIVAASHTLSPRGAPFAGWGVQYTTPGSISFNMVSVPGISRSTPASESEKWSTIRVEVRTVSTPTEIPLTGAVLAYGVASVDPESNALENLEFALLDPLTDELITLDETDLGAQFFVGYIALNESGGNAIAGECRGEAAEWNGQGHYYDGAWKNYDTYAMALNLYLASNLEQQRSVEPKFQSGGGSVETTMPNLSLAPYIYQAGDRQINTYFRNLTFAPAAHYQWDVVCNRGLQLEECYRLDDAQPPADVSLTINQLDPVTHTVVSTSAATLRMAAASAGTGVTRKLLMVGDSTTANGYMVYEVVDLFDADVMNIDTIGTQGSPVAGLHEGHSGWKTTDFTGPGRTFFEFSVSGVTEEPAINATEYDHNGSTYEVQEVNLSGGSGTIICERRSGTNDPLSSGTLAKSNASDGDATISFSAWQTVAGNPFWNDGTSELDFAGYMSANSFTMAADDWVMIHLGINDCFNGTTDAGVDALTAAAFPALDALIANIHAYQAGIRIGMCVPVPPPESQDAFGASYRCGQTRHRFMRNIHRWATNLIDYYSGQEAGGIYVVPLNSSWDTVNNALTVTEPVNSRSAISVDRQINGVHPHVDGYEQMADCIFSVIKYHE